MSSKKRLLVKSIILSIICISIFTIVLDFSRLFVPYNLLSTYNNDFIKRVIVFLAALLVWLAGRDSLSRYDTAIMKVVFILISCGEVCFLLKKPALAIAFFTVCQGLLIARHSRKLISKLSKARAAQKLKLAVSLLTLISLQLLGILIIYPMVKLDSTILMGILYSIVLSLSLWTGYANHALSLFPNKNAKMISIGMFLFYLCDITVGLDGLLWPGPAWLLVTSLTWAFYTPAITLLALSCYKYEESLSITQKKLKSF